MTKTFILGVSATKHFIMYAMLDTAASDLATMVVKADRLSIHKVRPTELVSQLCGIFDSTRAEFDEFKVGICQRSAGGYGSSTEAIKAEALIEYACDKHSLDYTMAHPNGFRVLLRCESGQKWQIKAKELFNGGGRIKYFTAGTDAAAVAAFKCASLSVPDKI